MEVEVLTGLSRQTRRTPLGASRSAQDPAVILAISRRDEASIEGGTPVAVLAARNNA